MRAVSRIGVGAAVLALVAGGVAAPGAASAAPDPNINFTSVELFNPTDPGTIPGYLQVAIFVTYNCTNGTTATIQGTYGPASQPFAVLTTCDDATHPGVVYARVPNEEGADPVEADGTYTVDVTMSSMLYGAANEGPLASTVSNDFALAPLTDMFPPYFFGVSRSKSHPASQAVVTWDPPLTIGSHPLTGYDVRDPDIGLHADLGPTAVRYVVKHLKSRHSYGFAMSALATDYAASTTSRTITTAPKSAQAVSLTPSRNHVSAHHKVHLSGDVTPAHGGYVMLERRVNGTWNKIARIHLHHGSYHHTIRPSAGSYTARVVALRTPDFKRSVSQVVTVTAHR
jgi:hypothetical protein